VIACQFEGCSNQRETRNQEEAKSFCKEHIASMPYVKQLIKEMENVEQ